MLILNASNITFPAKAANVVFAGSVGGYVVVDRHTNRQATKTLYKSRAAANRAVDGMDMKHGSYRYFAKSI